MDSATPGQVDDQRLYKEGKEVNHANQASKKLFSMAPTSLPTSRFMALVPCLGFHVDEL